MVVSESGTGFLTVFEFVCYLFQQSRNLVRMSINREEFICLFDVDGTLTVPRQVSPCIKFPLDLI